MAELKTKQTNASVTAHIAKVSDTGQREDAKKISAMLRKITKQKPKMWGPRIIGFGLYHYKSERSSQEGDWPMIGFAVGKSAVTIYLMGGAAKYAPLLKKLGKHKFSGGSCLYIKRLADVDMKVLEKIMANSYADMRKRYR